MMHVAQAFFSTAVYIQGGVYKIKTPQTERQEEALFIILYLFLLFFAKIKFHKYKGLYVEKS